MITHTEENSFDKSVMMGASAGYSNTGIFWCHPRLATMWFTDGGSYYRLPNYCFYWNGQPDVRISGNFTEGSQSKFEKGCFHSALVSFNRGHADLGSLYC